MNKTIIFGNKYYYVLPKSDKDYFQFDAFGSYDLKFVNLSETQAEFLASKLENSKTFQGAVYRYVQNRNFLQEELIYNTLGDFLSKIYTHLGVEMLKANDAKNEMLNIVMEFNYLKG